LITYLSFYYLQFHSTCKGSFFLILSAKGGSGHDTQIIFPLEPHSAIMGLAQFRGGLLRVSGLICSFIPDTKSGTATKLRQAPIRYASFYGAYEIVSYNDIATLQQSH
jgi:hypothetical protein